MQFEKTKIQSPEAGVLVTSSATRERPIQFDVWKGLGELHQNAEWRDGIARKVLIRCPDLQITLRAMKAKARIPQHHNPGRICVQTVQGHIRMHAGDELFDLPQGKMLVLEPGITHDVEALEESAFLLFVAPPTAPEV